MKNRYISSILIFCVILLGPLYGQVHGEDVVKVGLNYPETGPYKVQGLDQLRAAQMAVEEINASGGIAGKKVELLKRDSQSKPDVGAKNVEEMDKEGAAMFFGGASSGVAIAAGKKAKEKGKIYFGTLTYSNETTGKDGHKYMFRECYDSWMGAKVLAKYLNANYKGKKYFYITSNYTWGHTTEESIRKFTDTQDVSLHKGGYYAEKDKPHKASLTPFPGAKDHDFVKALTLAKAYKPDVLVLVLFGDDMVKALTKATAMGLKKTMAIVVPNLTLGMAQSAGPKVMEGVVGAIPWEWEIPYKYDYAKGKEFVEKFAAKYSTRPSSSGGSAYTILYQYKSAVERARSFDSKEVIKALEGHRYLSLKDEQEWRPFDHQSIQTVYSVKCKPMAEVLKDKYKEDYFEVIDSLPGPEAAISHSEWVEARKAAGKPPELEW